MDTFLFEWISLLIGIYYMAVINAPKKEGSSKKCYEKFFQLRWMLRRKHWCTKKRLLQIIFSFRKILLLLHNPLFVFGIFSLYKVTSTGRVISDYSLGYLRGLREFWHFLDSSSLGLIIRRYFWDNYTYFCHQHSSALHTEWVPVPDSSIIYGPVPLLSTRSLVFIRKVSVLCIA